MRPEKQLLLDEIQNKMDGSTALVVTRYQQLNPNMAANFRKQLINSGGDLEVVKKRVLLKAAEKAGFQLNLSDLQGHIALVFALQDPVSVTKVIYDFKKENEDVLEILGGRFEGQLCSAQDVKQIAELPSRDEMRAQFLGLLEAPMAETLSVMQALLTSVIYCVDNKSQQQS